MTKLTTEEFISKAKAMHGNRYDYSKVEYVDSKTKVCIYAKSMVSSSNRLKNSKNCLFLTKKDGHKNYQEGDQKPSNMTENDGRKFSKNVRIDYF